MKILFVAAEASPLAKVGGLADVVGSLPKALNILGHDVRLVIPKYGCISESSVEMVDYIDAIDLKLPFEECTFNVKTTEINGGTTTYLIENDKYFGYNEIYTGNDLDRFYIFNKAFVALLSQMEWQPDIIHCHDWHTGLVPMWLKQQQHKAGIVFTIHNLAYQGNYDNNFLYKMGLDQDWQNWLINAPQPQNNFMSHGIIWSDVVTTVSDSYAREIVTPEYGVGLDGLLRHYQQKLVGIINGIDYDEYNPDSDFSVVVNFSAADIDKRPQNKLYLQQKAGFKKEQDIPLIGMVSRLEEQKGIDLLIDGVESLLLAEDVQLFILGKGNDRYHSALEMIAKRYPEKMVLYPEINENFASQVYAGSDMFLMPSRFEPCGLGQMIAMRYGSVPIVRYTGGLIDTVQNIDQNPDVGNGFVFNEYNASAMNAAIKRAIAMYHDKQKWRSLIKKVMNLDFSWNSSAKEYESIYNKLLRNEKGS